MVSGVESCMKPGLVYIRDCISQLCNDVFTGQATTLCLYFESE